MAHVLAGLLQVVFVWREIADIYSPAVHLYTATDDAFIILCLSPPTLTEWKIAPESASQFRLSGDSLGSNKGAP